MAAPVLKILVSRMKLILSSGELNVKMGSLVKNGDLQTRLLIVLCKELIAGGGWETGLCVL